MITNFRSTFNFALILVLALAALPAIAQQTVDPSGSCTVSSFNPTITAQTGSFVCYPSALGSNSGTWVKINHGINTASFQVSYNNTTLAGTAALTANVALVTLPAGSVVLHARIKPTVQWAGTATLTGSIGDASGATAYTATQDLKAAVANTTFVQNTAPKITTEAGAGVLINFVATTNNLNVLSAGSLVATLVYALPAVGPITIADLIGIPDGNGFVTASYSFGTDATRVIDWRQHGFRLPLRA